MTDPELAAALEKHISDLDGRIKRFLAGKEEGEDTAGWGRVG